LPARAHPVERDNYIRGRLESRFVSASPQTETAEIDDLAELLRSYYEYRVWRHVRSFILSSSNDRLSLHKLVQTVVRLGFSILLSKSKEEAQASDQILVVTDFACRRIGSPPVMKASSSGFALGHAAIGRDIALGDSPAETVWTVIINVELKMSQATELRQRPDVVECIMKALERAIPLNLDYVLRFQVDESDYTMQLIRADDAKRRIGVAPPVVGLNTALGKVKKKTS
jgi:hypothetical protein